MIKLAVFDFDSTLMDGETIDFLAEAWGVGKEVRELTERAMRGELDFFESLCARVALLEGLEYRRAEAICKSLPLMKGAPQCISALKRAGVKVVCFSGGFRLATRHFASQLGLDADFSNILHTRCASPAPQEEVARGGESARIYGDEVLSGKVGGEMMFQHSKGDLLTRLQSLLGISAHETLAVGDGANDISMLERASYAVAFCAKPALKERASIIIEEKDLRQILPHLHLQPQKI